MHILPSQRLMFNHLTAWILASKLNLQREENQSTQRIILRVRLRSKNPSPRVEPVNQSLVVEEEGATGEQLLCYLTLSLY